MKPKPGSSSRSWDKDKDRSRYTTTRGGGSSTSKKRDGESSRTVQPKRKKRKTTKYTKYDRSDNKEDKKLHRGEHLSSDLDRVDDLENSPPCFKRSWVLGLFSLLSISMISKAGLSLSDAYTATFAPIAGRISKCISNWKIVSTGQWILNVVKHGYKLQFSGALPPTPHRFLIFLLMGQPLLFWILKLNRCWPSQPFNLFNLLMMNSSLVSLLGQRKHQGNGAPL